MKPLKQLCTPRDNVFDVQRRDTVLDLADLLEDRIQPGLFFETNFITEGMRTLLEQGFRRLEGKSSQGVFKLKQAMGGGKTHNLLVLGLLAKHPEFRQQIMGRFYVADPSWGPVTVIGFSGRESDAPLGIWGSLAAQLGVREHFRDCYAPLQAPGQKAWENLLADRTVLIFLDELPPYLENARAKAIGDSNLAKVSATALSNLLVAVGKEACSRICVVITDLEAAYQGGSQQLGEVLADFEKELRVSFPAVDSTGVHQAGAALTWPNRITLKHRGYQSGSAKRMELRAAPEAAIWYTTDGSDPKLAGAAYDGPFIVPRGAPLVLAYAERDGVQSAVENIPVSWEKEESVRVDARRAAAWKREARLRQHKGVLRLPGPAGQARRGGLRPDHHDLGRGQQPRLGRTEHVRGQARRI